MATPVETAYDWAEARIAASTLLTACTVYRDYPGDSPTFPFVVLTVALDDDEIRSANGTLIAAPMAMEATVTVKGSSADDYADALTTAMSGRVDAQGALYVHSVQERAVYEPVSVFNGSDYYTAGVLLRLHITP